MPQAFIRRALTRELCVSAHLGESQHPTSCFNGLAPSMPEAPSAPGGGLGKQPRAHSLFSGPYDRADGLPPALRALGCALELYWIAIDVTRMIWTRR